MNIEIKKVLVAEDDNDLKFMYEYILGREGFEVISVSNGQEAVEQFLKHRPDLILMDIRMPVKNGDEAIREILALDPQARIIAITAYSYIQAELGVPILRKGFSKNELLEAIKIEPL